MSGPFCLNAAVEFEWEKALYVRDSSRSHAVVFRAGIFTDCTVCRANSLPK